MGRLCAFYERTVPDSVMASAGGYDDVSTYIHLQSAHRPDWYLGFGPNPSHRRGSRRGRTRQSRSLGLVHTRDGHRAALPRRMPMFHGGSRKHHHRRADVRAQVEKRCDFSFATGRFVSPDPEDEWAGLFSALPDDAFHHRQQQQEAGTGAERAITKTATSKTKPTTPPPTPPSPTTTTTATTKTTPTVMTTKPGKALNDDDATVARKSMTTASTQIKNTHLISATTPPTTTQSEEPAATSSTANRNIELLIAEKMRKNPRFALAVRKRALLKMKMKRMRRARLSGPSFFYMHNQQIKVSRKTL